MYLNYIQAEAFRETWAFIVKSVLCSVFYVPESNYKLKDLDTKTNITLLHVCGFIIEV